MKSQLFNQYEFYYANLDGTGSEQTGRRPVMIIQNDKGNLHSPTLIVIPVTSRRKNELPTHVFCDEDFLSKDSILLTEQILTIDKRRIIGKCLGILNPKKREKVQEAIKISLDLHITGA